MDVKRINNKTENAKNVTEQGDSEKVLSKYAKTKTTKETKKKQPDLNALIPGKQENFVVEEKCKSRDNFDSKKAFKEKTIVSNKILTLLQDVVKTQRSYGDDPESKEKKGINDKNKIKINKQERPSNRQQKPTAQNTKQTTKESDSPKSENQKVNGKSRKPIANSEKKYTENGRKPTIKTIIAPNDATKVYKAVVFDDRDSERKRTAMKISVPTDAAKARKHGCHFESNSTISRQRATNTSRDRQGKAPRKNKRVTSSPDIHVKQKTPKTEVAKWEPSLARQAKPYYEAWIDTTLAAFSKISSEEKDRLLMEKEKVIEKLQKALADRDSSINMYNHFYDSKQFGKIKVNR